MKRKSEEEKKEKLGKGKVRKGEEKRKMGMGNKSMKKLRQT